MLKYTGTTFYPGIPARDLDEDEIADLDATVFVPMQCADPALRKTNLRQFLLASGLYVEQKINQGPESDKALRPGRSTK